MKTKFEILLQQTTKKFIVPRILQTYLENEIYKAWAACHVKEKDRRFENLKDIGEYYDPILKKFSIEFNEKLAVKIAKKLRKKGFLT